MPDRDWSEVSEAGRARNASFAGAEVQKAIESPG